MEPDDAEQTAMIGLMQAANRFEPDRGYQFSTYASYWIRQACQRNGLKWGLPLHVPANYFWRCYKLEFREIELLATYGPFEARSQFAEELDTFGVKPEQWRHYQLARNLIRFSEVDRREQASLNPSERPCASSFADDETTKEAVERALCSLHPRMAQILKLRYGIGEEECTLQEIAEMLNLTRERIRQIQVVAEKKILRLLRKHDHSHAYAEAINPAATISLEAES